MPVTVVDLLETVEFERRAEVACVAFHEFSQESNFSGERHLSLIGRWIAHDPRP
jgi:hypothetical protein